MRLRKGIIIEISLIIIFVALAILMYNYEVDLVLFKVYNTKTLKDCEINLEKKQSQLANTRANYKMALSSLESAKNEFNNEKALYESISEETIAIINEATQGEEYNIEYMWIQLGNYAKENNLDIVLYEPGAATADQAAQSSTTQTQANTSTTSTSTQVDKMQTDLSGRGVENMRIKVQGTYINVSEFIYDVENDSELRFNLDNIRMEYMANNEIAAIFEVKGLILNN